MRRYLKTKSQEIGRKTSKTEKMYESGEWGGRTEMEKLCCKLREEKELGKKREREREWSTRKVQIASESISI